VLDVMDATTILTKSSVIGSFLPIKTPIHPSKGQLVSVFVANAAGMDQEQRYDSSVHLQILV